MIRVICEGCKSTLNAKDELAGQTRKCPKCGAPVVVPEPVPTEILHTEGTSEGVGQTSLRQVDAPARLEKSNRYLIFDRAKPVAGWKGDGQGWMLKTTAGMISAERNQDQIPGRGNYTLVELKLASTDAGHRLGGIMSYQLSRWALTKLGTDENSVLSSIAGPGCLNKEQKNAVRQVIRDEFIYDVWKDAQKVLDYLGNTDYHSPGIG
jgi:hypothetical protein